MSSETFMEKFSDRIKTIMGNLEQVEFANKCGVSLSAVQSWLYKERIPKGSTLLKLYNEFGVNTHWLITGKGEAYEKEARTIKKDLTVSDLIQDSSEKNTPSPSRRSTDKAATFDDISLSQAIEQLAKIFHSGDMVLIRAINANLHAFSETVDAKKRELQALFKLSEMESVVNIMRNKIEALEKEMASIESEMMEVRRKASGE